MYSPSIEKILCTMTAVATNINNKTLIGNLHHSDNQSTEDIRRAISDETCVKYTSDNGKYPVYCQCDKW